MIFGFLLKKFVSAILEIYKNHPRKSIYCFYAEKTIKTHDCWMRLSSQSESLSFLCLFFLFDFLSPLLPGPQYSYWKKNQKMDYWFSYNPRKKAKWKLGVYSPDRAARTSQRSQRLQRDSAITKGDVSPGSKPIEHKILWILSPRALVWRRKIRHRRHSSNIHRDESSRAKGERDTLRLHRERRVYRRTNNKSVSARKSRRRHRCNLRNTDLCAFPNVPG